MHRKVIILIYFIYLPFMLGKCFIKSTKFINTRFIVCFRAEYMEIIRYHIIQKVRFIIFLFSNYSIVKFIKVLCVL